MTKAKPNSPKKGKCCWTESKCSKGKDTKQKIGDKNRLEKSIVETEVIQSTKRIQERNKNEKGLTPSHMSFSK